MSYFYLQTAVDCDETFDSSALTSVYQAVTDTNGLNNKVKSGKISGLVRLYDSVLLEMEQHEVSKAATYPLDLVQFAAPSIYKSIEADTPHANPTELGKLFDWLMWNHWMSRFERLGVHDLYHTKAFFDDNHYADKKAPRMRRKLSKTSKLPSTAALLIPAVAPGLQRYAFTGDVHQVVRSFSVWFLYSPMPFVPSEQDQKGRYMFNGSQI